MGGNGNGGNGHDECKVTNPNELLLDWAEDGSVEAVIELNVPGVYEIVCRNGRIPGI